MYGALEISTSGLIAQRTRLEAIAANIAGKDALVDASGAYNPYRRREVMLAVGDPNAATPEGRNLGVHVARIVANENALKMRHDPTHPFADEGGYVRVPDIDPVTERVNAMEATRAYEANIVAAEATKTMMAQVLRLLA